MTNNLSSMNYSIFSNRELISTKEWSDFLGSHPDGNYFQSELYYNFNKSLQDSDPHILFVKNEKDEIRGLLICVFQKNNTNKSTRCIIYGGPLVNVTNNEEEIYKLLFDNIITIIPSNCEYIEIRNLFIQTKHSHLFKKYGFIFQDHLNIIINTTSSCNPLENISKNKLKQVKQSIKNGAEIIEAQNLMQVKEFYNILLYLYKNKVKKGLPRWEFFKEFYLQGKKNNCGKYFLVKYENKIIGGIMCPIFNSKTLYEWYICGLDKKYKGVHPSILATYSAIKYAKNNFTHFDFMGAGKPDIEYGVRTFKKQFGGEIINFGRYLKLNS